MPNLNTGKPRSEMDERDLKGELREHGSLEMAADHLCRDPEEVAAWLQEPGFLDLGSPAARECGCTCDPGAPDNGCPLHGVSAMRLLLADDR